ncbi:cyclin [Phycomyces blakesleeanus]|uniref:Cyclin n=2 Tax=Phycomyces blakesleeanus TaxID=4837 RepID=A0A162XWY6_PHYB8|nr:cyclin [Phycomyces blakesleeanus NRRL 1555(-)]OAD76995.1 cyclin [Phycomyces blakesleeanus NRRL 1555(-)]|eukprot:XP_018295035.1 cyclin [Phycomyces blakesleeanus NRRL 1555(-)]
MGTTKSRKSRRNTSRPTAISFLSAITLGSEHEKQNNEPNHSSAIVESKAPGDDEDTIISPVSTHPSEIRALSLHSTDSSSTFESQRQVHNLTLDTTASRDTTIPPPLITPITGTTSQSLDSQLPPTSTDNKSKKRGQPTKHESYHSTQTRYSQSDLSESVEHHKLTREDSKRPIASEKIKKRSTQPNDKDPEQNGMNILSVFRYYSDKIRHSTSKRKPEEDGADRGYVHQQQLTSNDSYSRRKKHSYAHFLQPANSLKDDETIESNIGPDDYDPFYLDNDLYGSFGVIFGSSTTPLSLRPAELKRETNEQFRLAHPEINPEITLSKIRSIKSHLLTIGRGLDLEVSSISHAYVYFEKLVLKNVATKKNRKLLAACCLFLATKANEPKGAWLQPLLDAIDDELNIDSEEIKKHEFAVFADLEFNLFIPRREFMPHFERIFKILEYKSIRDYLGDEPFYEVDYQ